MSAISEPLDCFFAAFPLSAYNTKSFQLYKMLGNVPSRFRTKIARIKIVTEGITDLLGYVINSRKLKDWAKLSLLAAVFGKSRYFRS